MTKSGLIEAVAERTPHISKKDTEIVVNTIFDAAPGKGIIAIELDAGRKVVIPGFGTFFSRTRAPRAGTVPGTGASIEIPRKSYVYFKPGKTLRERVEK